MASTWNLLKKVGQKTVGDITGSFGKPKGARIDLDLPLGLRINGMVDVPEVDFILGGDELKIKYPGGGAVVASFGVVPVGDSKLRRFYLNTSKGVYILQLATDKNKAIEECKLFMPYDEVYPDDWDFWLSEKDGYIGYNSFQTKDGTTYTRVWQDEGAEVVIEQDDQGNRITRIPPVRLDEVVHFDAYDEQREMVKYQAMLYGRNVDDKVDEYLLVAAVEDKDGASVQIMVGIELQATFINVI